MNQKFCPKCNSEQLDFISGGLTGEMKCRDCGYQGIFPEREEINFEEEKKLEENKKELKNENKEKN